MKKTTEKSITGLAVFVRHAAKTGGILLILTGILMFSGMMSTVSADSSRASDSQTEKEEEELYPAPEWGLYDQYGKKHKLEDHRLSHDIYD